jgi:hypothetical protein
MSLENAAATSGEPDKTNAGQIKISGGLIARNPAALRPFRSPVRASGCR